jgi:hypothetical protein
MTKIHSIDKKQQAIRLRGQGKSLRVVAKKLNVSLSTAQLWTKGVILSEEQKLKISLTHARKLVLGRDQYNARRRVQKTEREKFIFFNAKKEMVERKSDSFFIMGLALYWAEGFKKDHSLGFVNSDPVMIAAFLKWLNVYGDCKDTNIRLRVQIHEIYKPHIEATQLYWSNLLEVPVAQFQMPFFQVSKTKPNLIDPTYRGLLRIRIIGARDLFVKILGWLEGLRELSSQHE